METLNYWPLVVTLEDAYVPELARLVMEVAYERESEVRAVLFQLWAIEAEYDLTNHRN